MKRIAIFCVSYLSDKERDAYLASINIAAKKAVDKVIVDVFVANNTKEDNPGYFGAVKRMMDQKEMSIYDYSIISNVDLALEEDFFIKLADYECAEDTGWIAPQIWSAQESRDLNPKISERYPYFKLKILQFLHHHPSLHKLYSKTLYNRKRVHSSTEGSIYAGHGSFIILTKKFIERCGTINYPIFLFCEEIYLAELCRVAHLNVTYTPNLRIFDREHISTGKMSIKEYSRLNYEAVSYILNEFYQNR